MKATELNLTELLDFEPAEGRIRFKDHRMLLWHADAFGNLGSAGAAASLLESSLPLAEVERRYVLKVLSEQQGNRTVTARTLGIGANTLWRKLRKWGVLPAGEA